MWSKRRVSSPLEAEVPPQATEVASEMLAAVSDAGADDKEDAAPVEAAPPDQAASAEPTLEGEEDAAATAAAEPAATQVSRQRPPKSQSPSCCGVQAVSIVRARAAPTSAVAMAVHRRKPARKRETVKPAGPPFQGRRQGDGPDGAGKPKFNRDRYKGPPKAEGGRPDFRKGKPQDGQNGRPERGPKPAFQPRPREERPAQIDPLSPFAKLAALRDQLKK